MKTKNEYVMITPVRIPAHKDVQIKKWISQKKCCGSFDIGFGNAKCYYIKCL